MKAGDKFYGVGYEGDEYILVTCVVENVRDDGLWLMVRNQIGVFGISSSSAAEHFSSTPSEALDKFNEVQCQDLVKKCWDLRRQLDAVVEDNRRHFRAMTALRASLGDNT